jgi:hypothetical protein
MRFKEKMIRVGSAGTLGMMLCLSGCDRPTPAPTPAIAPATASTAPVSASKFAPPINGASVRTNLVVFPLTAELPPSWRISMADKRTILRGHSPFSRSIDDELEILLTYRGKQSQNLADRTIENYKSLDQQFPDITFTSTALPDVKLMEYLEFLRSPSTRPSQETGIVTTRWVFRAYTGAGPDEVHDYEFSVVNMTEERLKKDAEFVRAIFSSLRREDSKP